MASAPYYPAPPQPAPPGQPIQLVYQGNTCPHCQVPVSAPRYAEGYTYCEIVLFILFLIWGIIPGIIYWCCCCRRYFVPYCPNCGGRLA